MHSFSLDIANLRSLDALLTERHVSRAADKVGITQPAMSRALARLREVFADELLIRADSGYVLSARAVELIEPTRRILNDLDGMLAPTKFEPQQVDDQLTLAGLDFELQLFLPRVLARFRQEAPHATLRALQFSRAEFRMLDDFIADAVITAFPSSGEHYRRRRLYRNDDMACVMSPATAHRLGGVLTLEQFVEMSHGLVSFEQHGVGTVDSALAALGLRRRIAIRVPGFLLVPQICAKSDIIFTLPRRLALAFPRAPKVAWMPVPLTLEATTTYVYWHPRNQVNPLQQWFREILFDVGRDIVNASASSRISQQ